MSCALGLAAVAACNLTASDYRPVRVDVEPALPTEMDAGQVGGGGSDGNTSTCPGAPGCTPVCSGSECTPDPDLITATCDDGDQNGAEVGVDCGSVCPRRCGLDSDCNVDDDCESLSCRQGRCVAPGCADEVLNQDETGVDCGGEICVARCPDGSACQSDADCESQVCGNDNLCAAPSCADGVVNQDESDEDCGGSCQQRCGTGDRCVLDSDCLNQVCGGNFCPAGVDSCCQPPTCTDGIANGGEPVPDCGNFRCGLCPLGRPCLEDNDCQSGFCGADNICAIEVRCDDQIQNGDEPSVDCGGSDPACPRCVDQRPCFVPGDCVNNNCFNGVCISCGSTVVDGTETDVDCGGADPACQRCLPGQRCLIGSDCASGGCFGGFCG